MDQPTAASDHFTLPGHSLNNLERIPLELINSNRDAIRKAREAFLIYKGKTLDSLRSWRDFACECFCFGSEAVNASGEAVRGISLARAYGGFAAACPLTNPASYAG